MNQIVFIITDRVPAVITASGDKTTYSYFEFFTAQIRNPHMRRVHARSLRPSPTARSK
jgi:hypothetical protein